MSEKEKISRYESSIIYGSTGYKVLSVAVSLKRPFNIDDINRTAPGIIKAQKRSSALSECAKRLAKHGLLERLENGYWAATPDARTCLVIVANKMQEKRYRLLGARYMTSVRERLSKVSGFNLDMATIDEEDAILDEVSKKYRKRLDRNLRPSK